MQSLLKSYNTLIVRNMLMHVYHAQPYIKQYEAYGSLLFKMMYIVLTTDIKQNYVFL